MIKSDDDQRVSSDRPKSPSPLDAGLQPARHSHPYAKIPDKLVALSIRQPWAHAIVHLGKRIENRKWNTLRRGLVLLHAAKLMRIHEYGSAVKDIEAAVFRSSKGSSKADVPAFDDLDRGGIVGAVEIVGTTEFSTDPWFQGPVGIVVRNPVALPFIPCRGALGFFDPGPEAVAAARAGLLSIGLQPETVMP